MHQLKPIPTRYKGYHFRSRLEARWAVFFDALRLPWEYEPQGFSLKSGFYLPDFKVTYPDRGAPQEYWFECKGDLSSVRDDEWARMIEFEEAIDANSTLIVLDGVPERKMYLSPKLACGWESDSDSPPPKRPYKATLGAFLDGRHGFALYSHKERPWFDEPAYLRWSGTDEVIDSAVAHARSARFEHGECGAT